MYRSLDENVFPKRIYREPEEIKEDISHIHERIAEINDMINIREFISDSFDDEGDLCKRAERIVELLQYASEALEELKDLNRTLDELKVELIESIRIVGRGEIGKI